MAVSRSADRGHCSPHSDARVPVAWATSSRPFKANRTASFAIRWPGVLLVQGGPGTGKTAVALHRAAYLLFTHRATLERQGVLVVGPNPLFLNYIENVLPSLGESGVTLSTISGLVTNVEIRGRDSGTGRRAKGRPAHGAAVGTRPAHAPATVKR